MSPGLAITQGNQTFEVTQVQPHQRTDHTSAAEQFAVFDARAAVATPAYVVVVSGAPGVGTGLPPPELVEGLPISLLDAYASRAMRHARVREVDPGVWVATVVGLDGAYGEGSTAQEAEADLREAIIGWVVVRRRQGLSIPAVEGLDLDVRPGPAELQT